MSPRSAARSGALRVDASGSGTNAAPAIRSARCAKPERGTHGNHSTRGDDGRAAKGRALATTRFGTGLASSTLSAWVRNGRKLRLSRSSRMLISALLKGRHGLVGRPPRLRVMRVSGPASGVAPHAGPLDAQTPGPHRRAGGSHRLVRQRIGFCRSKRRRAAAHWRCRSPEPDLERLSRGGSTRC